MTPTKLKRYKTAAQEIFMNLTWNNTRRRNSNSYFPLFFFQTPGAQCVLWHRGDRTHTVGAVFVPPSGLGHLLLLHLEGSEIHGKGRT